MIKDRRLITFLGITTIYFLIVISVMTISGYSDFWIETWFSERFFLFHFSILYLLGCAIIDKHFNHMHCFRNKNRKTFITEHISLYLVFALLLTSIVFIIVMIFIALLSVEQSSQHIIFFVDKYIKFIAGLFLIGLLSLNIKYTNYKNIKSFSHLISYTIPVAELMIVPKIEEVIGYDFKFIFSLIFENAVWISYSVLLSAILLLMFNLYRRINKVDLFL